MSAVNNNNFHNTTVDYNNPIIDNLTDTWNSFKNRINKRNSIEGSSNTLEKQVSDSPLPRSKRGVNYAIVDDVKKDIRDEVWDEIVIVHGFNPKALGTFDRQNIDQFNNNPDLLDYLYRRIALKLERRAEIALGSLDYIIADVLPPGTDDYEWFAKALEKQPGWEDKGLLEWNGQPSTAQEWVSNVRYEINSYIQYYIAEYQREHPDDGPETVRYRATERLFNLVSRNHAGSTNDLLKVIEQTTGRKFSPL